MKSLLLFIATLICFQTEAQSIIKSNGLPNGNNDDGFIISRNICFGPQTYLQGPNVIPLSEATTCDLLPQSKRLSTDQTFKNLIQIDPEPFEKGANDVIGESWWIDGMLVTMITRKITSENRKENLIDLKNSSAPEIRYRKGTTPDRTRLNDYFSEIKSVNNFEVLVYYYKTRRNYKSFFIQDNKGKFKIRGAIYVQKKDAAKAHKLIDTILNNLKFKE